MTRMSEGPEAPGNGNTAFHTAAVFLHRLVQSFRGKDFGQNGVDIGNGSGLF